VKTPNQNGSSDFKVGDKRKDDVRTVRTSRDYRDLWKKAIRQQILLVRMEKENKRLRGGSYHDCVN
jgi:TBC1 domain-containing protein 4